MEDKYYNEYIQRKERVRKFYKEIQSDSKKHLYTKFIEFLELLEEYKNENMIIDYNI